MAIYSLNVSSVGRTTHAPGTAGAHIRYIARPDAEPVLLSGGGLTCDPVAARATLDRSERADRRNARVIDKVRIALPIELSEAERAELARTFARQLTGDRVPWYGAIHQTGEDQHNPHLHLVIRDRDRTTGKRVVRLSDSARDWKAAGRPGDAPCAYLRELWEETCNEFLAEHRHDQRIDRRTLEAQGIDRAPQIHLGPRGQYVETHKDRPDSRHRPERSWRRTQYRQTVPYPEIDGGRTRREYNESVIDLNLAQAARSRDFVARSWARFEKDQAGLDRALAAQHRVELRAENQERETVRLTYRALRNDAMRRRADTIATIKAASAATSRASYRMIEAKFQKDRAALSARHAHIFQKLKRALDPTGRTARSHLREVRELERQHRRTLRASLQAERDNAKAALLETKRVFRSQLAVIRTGRDKALETVARQQLAAGHRRQDQWQARERDRERHRREMTDWIAQQAKRESARAKRVELYEQARKSYAPDEGNPQHRMDQGYSFEQGRRHPETLPEHQSRNWHLDPG